VHLGERAQTTGERETKVSADTKRLFFTIHWRNGRGSRHDKQGLMQGLMQPLPPTAC